MDRAQEAGNCGSKPAANGGRITLFNRCIVAAFLCRGVVLCCILPPTEMWDEYAHFSRIAFLHENGRSPVFGLDSVPLSVMRQMVRYPEPTYSGHPITPGPHQSYAEYWQRGARPLKFEGPLPGLYEAQQSPLYYWLMLPVFDLAGGADHFLNTVAVLRLINVGLGAGALAVFLRWVAGACNRRRYAMAIGLWATLAPMILLNCARVANDSLAFLLATIAVVWTLSLTPRRLVLHAAGIGAVAGLGILSKATAAALIPFVVIYLLGTSPRLVPWRHALAAPAVFLLVVCAEIGPMVIDSYHRFGVPFQMQEAIYNHEHGIRMVNLLIWLRPDHWWAWWADFHQCFLDGGLWVGGWSILVPAHDTIIAYEVLLWLAVLGAPLNWGTKRAESRVPPVFRSAATAWGMALFFMCVVAGMAVHAAESMTAWGFCSTGSWYAVPGLPWGLALLAAAALGWRRIFLGRWSFFMMPVFFIATEVFNEVTKMIPMYSQHRVSMEAFHRLSALHPSWLGFGTLAVASGLGALFLLASFALAVRETWRGDAI